MEDILEYFILKSRKKCNFPTKKIYIFTKNWWKKNLDRWNPKFFIYLFFFKFKIFCEINIRKIIFLKLIFWRKQFVVYFLTTFCIFTGNVIIAILVTTLVNFSFIGLIWLCRKVTFYCCNDDHEDKICTQCRITK